MRNSFSRRSLIGLSDYSKSVITAPVEDYWSKNVLDPMYTLSLNMYEHIVTLKVGNMRVYPFPRDTLEGTRDTHDSIIPIRL